MGYTRHHAIIVTADASNVVVNGGVSEKEKFSNLHGEIADLAANARDMTHYVSEITPVSTNSYASFFIAPDGSKEGWTTSDNGDVFRDAVIGVLNERIASGLWVSYVEVQYCDDEGDNRITRMR